MSLKSNHKGEIAKLRVELKAAEKGWLSSRTVEGSRYDLILDDGKKLYRTQVKYCDGKSSHAEGAVQVELRKTKYNGDTKTYNSSEIDVLLVYVPKADKLCWFDSDNFENKNHITLRYELPKNGQKKGIRLVKDFTW